MSSSVIDISIPIAEDMVVFEGLPAPRLERIMSLADGAVADVSRVEMAVHTGTHIDAPSHFVPGGDSIDSISLEVLIGNAHVIDATDADGDIGVEELEGRLPAGTERVLLKTRNSAAWMNRRFSREYCAVSAEGAAWLIEQGVRLAGIDYLSIAPYSDPVPTHRLLLEAGVVILEGLDLRQVDEGAYELICLPIRISGSEAAPARAVLIRPE